MPRAVFENKYSRPTPSGRLQTWAERIEDVVRGNFALDPRLDRSLATQRYAALDAARARNELHRTLELARAGVFSTSGRHLQHGDAGQVNRIMELHSNCATALFSFMSFKLLLCGAGVGRDYSSATCRVNWDRMPDVRLVMSDSHPDFHPDLFQGSMEPLREARHKYPSDSEDVRWFVVEDSRDGWTKVVEILETAAWQEKHADKLFIFDFSEVRGKGMPIRGMQNRPSSGPIPTMWALQRVASVKGSGMAPWKQAMFIDHYLAACVHVGGARRSARMATKYWRDRDVIEFIDLKRGGFLWSANNSVLVDEKFWREAAEPQHTHARRVFEAAVNAAYWDRTGEPGFINVDMLNDNRDGMDAIDGSNYISLDTYPSLHRRTREMVDNVLTHVRRVPYQFITNPCGEIVLALYGGYCVIGDLCLAQVHSKLEALDAADLMARFLVRCNLMKSDYASEVQRTNRIGVSLTGIHEFAWNLFGLTFQDLIRDPTPRSTEFWNFVGELRSAAETAAAEYSAVVGMVTPHTVTTIKPSGTVSKVMNCTEGGHLPASPYYLRWVQYNKTAADLPDLVARGYPVKDIGERYHGQVVVGFPTRQPIAELMGDNVTSADDTTMEENFRWLMLLEKYWLGEERGRNNQVSYTLKYQPDRVSYPEFMQMILEWQPRIRCCAVMPSSDWRATEKLYGYVPEQPITATEYADLMNRILAPVEREAYDDAALACASGVCPIEEDVR
jgi:adenosylcobalamin-dependent ribonucleoside-triphosphate reductase